MTREEAYETLKTGICLICAYGCKNMDDCDISYCDIRDAVKMLIQESCEDAWIIDTLKEFLGESYSVLTSNKKEFISWLERLRWHVVKCNELDIELRNYKKQVECEDAISRQTAIDKIGKWLEIDKYNDGERNIMRCTQSMLSDLPSVQPKIKVGHWITKPHVYGVTYCSECDFELKIDNTNYCPNCGCRMVKSQESEDKE